MGGVSCECLFMMECKALDNWIQMYLSTGVVFFSNHTNNGCLSAGTQQRQVAPQCKGCHLPSVGTIPGNALGVLASSDIFLVPMKTVVITNLRPRGHV